MQPAGEPEALIYREEVLGIIGALADLVVDIRGIRAFLEENGEEEKEQEGAD